MSSISLLIYTNRERMRVMSYLISCNNLTKHRGDYVLNDINFDLEPGYVLGVIGVNGVGKTTLIRCLLGSYRIDTDHNSGKVSVLGKDLVSEVIDYKKQIGFVLQDFPFNDAMTAIEIAEVYGKYYDRFDMKQYKDLLDEYDIPYMNVKDGKKEKKAVMQKNLRELSKGEQIRVQLAFARACNPKLFIFDEATGNLDVAFRERVYSDIRELTASGECSVIYATHLVEEMEEFADYLLWLRKKDNQGYAYYYGTIEELRSDYRILEADMDVINKIPVEALVGVRKSENHKEAMVRVKYHKFDEKIEKSMRYPELKEIMYYVEKGKGE